MARRYEEVTPTPWRWMRVGDNPSSVQNLTTREVHRDWNRDGNDEGWNILYKSEKLLIAEELPDLSVVIYIHEDLIV